MSGQNAVQNEPSLVQENAVFLLRVLAPRGDAASSF